MKKISISIDTAVPGTYYMSEYYISQRSQGEIDSNGTVTITKILSYDIVNIDTTKQLRKERKTKLDKIKECQKYL